MDHHILALAVHLGCATEEIDHTSVKNHFTGPDDSEWLVFPEAEASGWARREVKESLWAFRPTFLAEHTKLPVKIFEAIQDNQRCESNNDVLKELIRRFGGLRSFCDKAIKAYGRGHFLSLWDGLEHNVTIQGNIFCLYRVN